MNEEKIYKCKGCGLEWKTEAGYLFHIAGCAMYQALKEVFVIE